MHFACYYGLGETVYVTLDEGDGLEQCSIPNDADNLTPLELATQRGHTHLEQIIKDYQEVTSTWKAFKYIQDLCKQNMDALTSSSPSNTTPSSEEEESQETQVSIDVNDKIEPLPEIILPPQVQDNRKVSLTGREDFSQDAASYINVNKSKPKKPTPVTRKKLQKDYLNLRNADFKNAKETNIDAPTSPDNKLLKVNSSSIKDYYDLPRKTSEEYSIPPLARPLLPGKKKQSPVLVKKNSDSLPVDHGYLIMAPAISSKNSESSGSSNSLNVSSSGSSGVGNTGLQSQMHPSAVENPNGDSHWNDHKNISTIEEDPDSTDATSGVDSTEMELIELMKAFKQNKYTMKEIETMFEAWKSRSDVHTSMQEKYESLKQMREEYKKMAKNNKNLSAFERIKSKFTSAGHKKKDAHKSIVLTRVNPEPPKPIKQQDMRKFSKGSSDSSSDISLTSMEKERSYSVSSSSGMRTPPKNLNNDAANNNVEVEWGDPLSQRFCPSYIGPAQVKETEQGLGAGYQVPPPPRPIKKSPSPSVASSPSPSSHVAQSFVVPPPRPKKPIRALVNVTVTNDDQSNSQNPPPLPTRNLVSNILIYPHIDGIFESLVDCYLFFSFDKYRKKIKYLVTWTIRTKRGK